MESDCFLFTMSLVTENKQSLFFQEARTGFKLASNWNFVGNNDVAQLFFQEMSVKNTKNYVTKLFQVHI